MKDSNGGQDDAFARALKETFGEKASPDRIRQARGLYARHRTDDVLKHRNSTVYDKKGRGEPPSGIDIPDQPR